MRAARRVESLRRTIPARLTHGTGRIATTATIIELRATIAVPRAPPRVAPRATRVVRIANGLREASLHQTRDLDGLHVAQHRRPLYRRRHAKTLGRRLEQMRANARLVEVRLRHKSPLRVERPRDTTLALTGAVIARVTFGATGAVIAIVVRAARAMIARGHERSPADVTTATAPLDVRGTPLVVRNPRPVIVEPTPASVVERQPAPIPFTREGPTPIGPHPRAARLVGCEIHAHDRGVWTPHGAVVIDLDPLAVLIECHVDLVVCHCVHRVAGIARLGVTVGIVGLPLGIHRTTWWTRDDGGLGRQRFVVGGLTVTTAKECQSGEHTRKHVGAGLQRSCRNSSGMRRWPAAVERPPKGDMCCDSIGQHARHVRGPS